jgi:membrane protein implicated in regulation of membrane protease activity
MSWVLWVALAVALAAVEAATADFVFVMLAGGALGGAVASGLGASMPVQVLVAAAVALFLLGLVRPAVKRRFTVRNPEPMGSQAEIGRVGVVVEEVTDRTGRVKLYGELWSARAFVDGAVFEPGDEVVVVAVQGATVVVSAPAA